MPCLRLLPPFQEEGDFGFSPDQWYESSGLSHIKATGGTTLPEHLVQSHGLGDTTQDLCSHVLALKIPLHQAIRHFADGNGIGRSEPLYSGGNIGCFTEC